MGITLSILHTYICPYCHRIQYIHLYPGLMQMYFYKFSYCDRVIHEDCTPALLPVFPVPGLGVSPVDFVSLGFVQCRYASVICRTLKLFSG